MIDIFVVYIVFFVFTVLNSSDIHIDIRQIALNICASISSLGNFDQIKVMLGFDLLQVLCHHLCYRNDCHETTYEVRTCLF